MDELLNTSMYSFMFLLLGCVCLLLEVFVPSGGILGFLAVFSSGFGIFGLFYQDQYLAGFGSMAGVVGYASLMFYIIIKKITFKGAMTPENSTSVDERLLLDDLVGVEGVAVTAGREQRVRQRLGRLAGIDAGVGVADLVELRLDGLQNARMAVAEAGDRRPARPVDDGVAGRVGDHQAMRLAHDHRVGGEVAV